MKLECGSCHLIPEKRAEVSSTKGSLWFRIEKCGHQICFICADRYKAHYESIQNKRDAGGGYSKRGTSGGDGKCLRGSVTIEILFAF